MNPYAIVIALIHTEPNTRLPNVKVRDYIDINPTSRHPGWKVGQIRRVDRFSGQVQVVYKDNGQEFLYWAHLNNPDEVAPFMTKAEQTIQSQGLETQESIRSAPNPSKENSHGNDKPKHNKNASDQPKPKITNHLSTENNRPKNENDNEPSGATQHASSQSFSSRRITDPPSRPLPDLNLTGKHLPPKPKPKKKPPVRGKAPQENDQFEQYDSQEQDNKQANDPATLQKHSPRELPPSNNKSPTTRNAFDISGRLFLFYIICKKLKPKLVNSDKNNFFGTCI
ncbi:selenocysteine-specific elongation factor selB -like protein [Reticulomyxa filosa]|uniref:Selenocysteine-specific elongation factor selB-like protein n=1 Tax=Reticulomyxa filosa TaxID=46433 RepID=X6MJW7_RETFI|nr:selenocysteine-specific elongation factor selB -like protein [Reticulomyxa filosa]|eukprot:ETO13350.1 selenocysteine-specific elongation factor selB -like protein [Reticulomyxa filosa]